MVINKIKSKTRFYVGATVLNPTPGFHLLIIILILHLFIHRSFGWKPCYSTWVHPDNHMRVKNMANVKYKMHTAGGKSTCCNIAKRDLPELEEELLAVRKIAKSNETGERKSI